MKLVLVFLFALAMLVVMILFYMSMRPSVQTGLISNLVAPLKWLITPAV